MQYLTSIWYPHISGQIIYVSVTYMSNKYIVHVSVSVPVWNYVYLNPNSVRNILGLE